MRYQLELYFSPPYDFLNRTVIITDKIVGYFETIEQLTSREKQLLIKTVLKEVE